MNKFINKTLNNKRGITLTTLAITIIVMLILSSAAVIATTVIINNSKTVAFATDLNNIEQAVETYYLENNELPKVTLPVEYTKNSLALLSSDNGAQLGAEIDINLEKLDKFYEISLENIKINNSSRGLKKTGASDIYVVNSRNLRVYYVKGIKIGNDYYFSLTEKLSKTTKIDRVIENPSNMSVKIETNGIEIIKSKKDYTNSLNISFASALGVNEKLRYKISDSNPINVNININSYELILDLNTMTSMSNVLESFTSAEKKNKTFVVEKYNETTGVVVAKANMNISNLDVEAPMNDVIVTVEVVPFSDFNTVTLTNVSDLGGSGIKNIRYEYSTKLDSNLLESDYLNSSIVIDSKYLLANGKKVTGNIIKLDKHIKSIKLIFTDNAENVSLVNVVTITDNNILTPETNTIYKDGYIQPGINGPSLIIEEEKIVTIPVIYDAGSWKIADTKTKWYEYVSQTKAFPNDNIDSKWANIVLVDSSNETINNKYYNTNNSLKVGTIIDISDVTGMFVWIPRYAYKIRSGFHTATNSPIDVKFIQGTGLETLEENITYTGDVQNEYLVNPAFNFADIEKTGLWVSKFEISNTTVNPRFIPGNISLRSNNVRTYFEAIRNMEKNNSYGWTKLTGTLVANTGLITSDNNTFDIHMIQNLEWGAVSYLAQSRYGRNGTEITINENSSYFSGGSDNLTTVFTSNVNQSTTGNAYGVYDMSGGAKEYTMAYFGTNNANASSGYNAGTMVGKLDNRYYNDYLNGNLNTIKGSGVYETSNLIGWNNDKATFVTATTAWFTRGGTINDSISSGIFNYQGTSGAEDNTTSTRAVIVVN